VAFFQLDAQQPGHEPGEPRLLRVAQQGCGDLGIEHRRRDLAGQVVEDLQVLPGGMEHLGDPGVLHEREQAVEIVQRQRVDAGQEPGGRDLHQAQPRPVGLLADELGVDGEPVGLCQSVEGLFEGGGVVDQLRGIHGARSISSTAMRDGMVAADRR